MEKVPPIVIGEDNWEEYYAPVVPPAWVKKKAEATQQPVDWENTRTIVEEGTGSVSIFPMLYRTKVTNLLPSGFITHLLPGSCTPVAGWLQKLSKD